MSLFFKSKHVVLTGATRGLGLEIAKILDASECRLSLLSRSCPSICSQQITFFELDLAHHASIPNVFRDAVQKNGSIDILINCAGVCHQAPFLTMDKAHLNQILQINLLAPIATVQAALRVGKLGRDLRGVIVNVGSKVVHHKNQTRGLAVYASSKSALEYFGEALAIEMRESGRHLFIKTVLPGLIPDTTMGKLASAAKRIEYAALEENGQLTSAKVWLQ